MMAKETQMDKLLEQAQQGMPMGIRGENNAAHGLPKSGRVRIVMHLFSFSGANFCQDTSFFFARIGRYLHQCGRSKRFRGKF
jgi:hypothetical protein